MKPLDFLVLVQRVRKRNHSLEVRLEQMTRSRDEWKAKALDRRREIENLRRQLKRRPPAPPRLTAKQHYGMVTLSPADLRFIRSLGEQ